MVRRLFLGALALASAALTGFVLIDAALTGHLTGQVFFAVLPLVLLFGIAWRGLRQKSE